MQWTIEMKPEGRNPAPPRDPALADRAASRFGSASADTQQGENQSGIIVRLVHRDSGAVQEVARVGFARQNTVNPDKEFKPVLDGVVARAREAVRLLNEDLMGKEGELL
jgi:hypothetical protein